MAASKEDALCSAAARGDAAAVEALLQAGAEVNGLNSFGQTPIQVMMMGSTRVARILLENGANPNVSDPHSGCTPLHDAARTGFLDTVKLLVQFGASPLATDNAQLLPVQLASIHGHAKVVSFLESL